MSKKPEEKTIFTMLGDIHTSIAVLSNKMDSFEKANDLAHKNIQDSNFADHKAVNDHLTKLNGQVIKNTKFRWQVLAYVPLATIIISGTIGLLFYKFQ